MTKSKFDLNKRKQEIRNLMRNAPVVAGGKAAMLAIGNMWDEVDALERKAKAK